MEGERDELRSNMEVTGRERDELRERVDGLLSKLARATTEADAVRAEATAALAETEAARTEAEAVRAELTAALAETEAARTEANAVRAETDEIRVEADAGRSEMDAIRAEADAARAEATAVAGRVAELEDRLARTEARAGSAEDARRQAETQAVEALERAKVAEGLLGEAEALLVEAEAEFRRAREADATTAAEPASDPVADPEAPATRVNGVNGSAGSLRPTTKVEVDTLVRRLVQESAGRTGRKVSVYAEPVVVLAPHGVIETIVSDLLERSVQRTSEGNRIVVHVERAQDGVLLSVEHGRPPEDDALGAETRRLVADLGGWAAVEPHPGGGSILRVLLPRETSADVTVSA
jgi:hypothetical protein